MRLLLRDRHTTFENKIGTLKICFCSHIAGIPVCTEFNENFFCSMHTCEGYKQFGSVNRVFSNKMLNT